MSADTQMGPAAEEEEPTRLEDNIPWLGLLRALIGVTSVVVLFVQWGNAQGVMGSAYNPSAVQAIQLQVDYFLAPAVLTIGVTIAAYIATRWR